MSTPQIALVRGRMPIVCGLGTSNLATPLALCIGHGLKKVQHSGRAPACGIAVSCDRSAK